MDQVLRSEAVVSRNELSKRFVLVPLALDHLIERTDQTSDHNDRRVHRNEIDDLPNGGDLIVLLVVD